MKSKSLNNRHLRYTKQQSRNINRYVLKIYKKLTNKKIAESILLQGGQHLGLTNKDADVINNLLEAAGEMYIFHDKLLKSYIDDEGYYYGLPITNEIYKMIDKIIFDKNRIYKYDNCSYLNFVYFIYNNKRIAIEALNLFKTSDDYCYIGGYQFDI